MGDIRGDVNIVDTEIFGILESPQYAKDDTFGMLSLCGYHVVYGRRLPL
jgi:hypothetical protein